MTWHIYGADSIVVPVLSGDEAGAAGESGLCDGPGSDCRGRGGRGVFASPVGAGSLLCPACLLAVRQRGFGVRGG